MHKIEELVDAFGIITTKEIVNNNLSKASFYNYLRDNEFEQISFDFMY